MRSYLAGGVLLLVVVGASRAQDGWQPYLSKGGRFVIAMPREPKVQTKNLETPAGTLSVTLYVAERDDTAFIGSYADYPAEVLEKGADAILDSARDNTYGQVQGQLLTETAIAIEEHPGRDITFEAVSGTFIGRSRIYLVNRRLFQIMVLAPSAQGLPAEVEQYLDSFKLAK